MGVLNRTGAERYAKWEARFQAGSQSASEVLTRQLAGVELKARVLATFESLYNMEGEVRAYLDAQGVSTLLIGHYLNFGRQMWKITQRFGGETAAVEAQVVLSMWVARGLSQAVCEGIRTQVFGVNAVASP